MKVKLKAKRDISNLDFAVSDMDEIFGTVVNVDYEHRVSKKYDRHDFYDGTWYWSWECIERIVDFRGIRVAAKFNPEWKKFIWEQEMKEIVG